MDSILELRPLLLRIFNEVEELQVRVRERDSMIKQLENTVNQLTKENNIYRKVVGMYNGTSVNPIYSEETQTPLEENSTHLETPVPVEETVKTTVKTEVEVEKKKIDLSKKGKSAEELASNRREYHREYRRRRREGRC